MLNKDESVFCGCGTPVASDVLTEHTLITDIRGGTTSHFNVTELLKNVRCQPNSRHLNIHAVFTTRRDTHIDGIYRLNDRAVQNMT